MRLKLLFIGINLYSLVCCDYNAKSSSLGFDSDIKLVYIPYINEVSIPKSKDDSLNMFNIEIGRVIYPNALGFRSMTSKNFKVIDDLFLGLFLNFDSVEFQTETKRLIYINPSLDDSLDYKRKEDVHWWNRENWPRSGDDFYYTIRKIHFQKYGEEIVENE